jgi:hypothetical protein
MLNPIYWHGDICDWESEFFKYNNKWSPKSRVEIASNHPCSDYINFHDFLVHDRVSLFPIFIVLLDISTIMPKIFIDVFMETIAIPVALQILHTPG